MSGLDVLGVDNVLLTVGDLGDARRFYADTLALPLKFEVASIGVAGYRLGEEEPGLLVRVGEGPPRVWLEVPDAKQAALELRKRGIAPLAEPFEVATGWTVEFSDPWGNVVGLTDYTKRPELGRTRTEAC